MGLDQRIYLVKKFPVKGDFNFEIPFEESTIVEFRSQWGINELIFSLLESNSDYGTFKIDASILKSIKKYCEQMLPEGYYPPEVELGKPWGSYMGLYFINKALEAQLTKIEEHPLWEIYYEAF